MRKTGRSKQPKFKSCANYGKYYGTGGYWVCRRCESGEIDGCGDYKRKGDAMREQPAVWRWTKKLWRKALEQSRKRYFPRYNTYEDCGFCNEMEKRELRGSYHYGCNSVCPAYEPCNEMCELIGESKKQQNARRGRIGRAWLRKVGPEHGVRMPT